MLLQAGKTIKEIVKFAELDNRAVTKVARKLDLEPTSEVQRRGKELYASSQGVTFQEIAKTLAGQGFAADDGATMHHLTVASWVKNYGWAWGGAANGDYAPERAATVAARSKYVLRLSKALDAEVNTAANGQRRCRSGVDRTIDGQDTCGATCHHSRVLLKQA